MYLRERGRGRGDSRWSIEEQCIYTAAAVFRASGNFSFTKDFSIDKVRAQDVESTHS